MMVKLELEFRVPEEELRNDEDPIGVANEVINLIKMRGYATELIDAQKRFVVCIREEKVTYGEQQQGL